MKFKFENLVIWQKSMDMAEEILHLTKKFPPEELYNLSTQIRRASDSIALNISEGSIGQSNAEFKKFISYSIRSLAEVVRCLYKAKRRTYISEEEFETHYENCFNLMNMMVAFRRNIS